MSTCSDCGRKLARADAVAAYAHGGVICRDCWEEGEVTTEELAEIERGVLSLPESEREKIRKLLGKRARLDGPIDDLERAFHESDSKAGE